MKPLRVALSIFTTLAAACGGTSGTADATQAGSADAPPRPDAAPDAVVCLAPGSAAPLVRDLANPVLRAGHTYADGLRDLNISDPNLTWDEAAQRFDLYYMGAHAQTFSDPSVQQIHHATSPDGASWAIGDTPALAAAPDPGAWDHVNTETPSVAFNPDAPADRRYTLVYSGAASAFPNGGFASYAIGVAFSADGASFTRLPASESPHAQAGLVLTGADAYPTAAGAIVADPELVFVAGTYHLFFSSFACGAACPTATAFGVGHATSTDAVHWTVAEAPVASLLRTPGVATTGGGQPSVVYDPVHCQWEMWLTSDAAGETAAQPAAFNNMAGVWRATSPDAITWQVDFAGARDLAWDAAAPGEPLGLLTGADVAIRGDERVIAYVGFDDLQVPDGFFLPDHTSQGFRAGVMTLDLARR